jgi:exosome complex component RRP4
MSNIKVENKDVVIPGQILAQGMDYLPGDNTFRDGENIHANTLGLFFLAGRVAKVTALGGPYVLKPGDKIIGQVTDILMSGWRMTTGTAYSAVMNVKDASSRFIRNGEDLSKILAIGDYAVVQITKVTSQNLIDLSMKEPGLRKVEGGRIIRINPQKVPRVIGKKGSMIGVLKDKTGCQITVGQNGFVWIKGATAENESKAENAVKEIERRSHEEGLTQKMEIFLGGAA